MDNFSDIVRKSNSTTRSSANTANNSVGSTGSLGSLGVRLGGCEISETATILEEGLRVCPLCQSELKLCILNFEEKVLLCENVECDYPFYEDDVPVYNADSDVCSISKYSGSKKPLDDASATCSIVSSSWSDVERITNALESDFTSSEYKLKNHKKNVAQKQKVQQLLKNMDYVKNLTNEMKEVNKIGRNRRITNNKYIKNLMSLQTLTGAKILEPEELKVVEKDVKIGQVQVNVNTDPDNSISCIKIELVDITNDEKRKAQQTTEISTT